LITKRPLGAIDSELVPVACVFFLAPEFGRENLGSLRRIAEHPWRLRIGGGEEAGGVGVAKRPARVQSVGH
jgi:hypothetical protein